MELRTILFVFFCASLGISITSAAHSEKTKSYNLDNGLTVIVQPDRRSQAVAVQLWYRVGSYDEQLGKTGLAHMLEHMMFKGTNNFPGDAFARKIAKVGGSHNAATASEYTVYYELLSSDRLELALKLEADRMNNLQLKSKDFLPEKDVVLEERRLRVEDNPNSLLYERLRAHAYLSTGYHHPVIGWMHDIVNLELQDAINWYYSWYGPNNATLVVVGNVNPDNVYNLVKKHFSKINPLPLPNRAIQSEQENFGERRFTLNLPARLPQVLLTYRVPNLVTAKLDWEPYALFVLANILGGNDTSRFSRKLERENNLAVHAGAYYDLLGRTDSLFTISAIPTSNTGLEELELEIKDLIEEIKNNPVNEDELQRAKMQVIAEDIYNKDNILTRASALGSLAVLGLPWDLDEKFVEKIKQVTTNQVKVVAENYLRSDKLTIGLLVPVNKDEV